MKRLSLVVIAFGGILILLGAMTALYTIGRANEEATRSMGLVMVSFGGLCMAIPFYLEGVALRKRYRPGESSSAKRNLSPCAVCAAPAATLWCTTHLLRICPNCLSRHDEPARCLYRTLGRSAGSSNRAGHATTRP